MAFLKLIRFKNLLMVLLTMILTKYALIDSIVAPKQITSSHFFLLIISVAVITAGGYIINDIFDVKTDTINKPNKVIIGNIISSKNAWIYYILLSSIGLILGAFVALKNNIPKALFIFPICSFLLFFYSSSLKKKPIIGNIVISFLISVSILIAYFFSYNYSTRGVNAGILLYYSIYSYAIFAFFTTLIREIIKDIEDVDGDYAINAKTLPLVIGRKRANRVAIGFTLLLILFLIIVLKEFVENKPIFLGYGILFLLLPLLYFSYRLWEAETKKDYHFLSNFMKLIMLSGILSMLLFKFI